MYHYYRKEYGTLCRTKTETSLAIEIESKYVYASTSLINLVRKIEVCLRIKALVTAIYPFESA